MSLPSIMTAKEVSAKFFNGKVSYCKILELAKKNYIPHSKIGGRLLFRKESLDTWMLDQEKTTKSN